MKLMVNKFQVLEGGQRDQAPHFLDVLKSHTAVRAPAQVPQT
jgi:hypothetical protein